MKSTLKREHPFHTATILFVCLCLVMTLLVPIMMLSNDDVELSLATQWLAATPTSIVTGTMYDDDNKKIPTVVFDKSKYNSTITGIEQMEIKIFYLQQEITNLNISQMKKRNININTFGTIVYLTTNLERDLNDLRLSLNNLNYNFLKYYNFQHYSITILHESLTLENMKNISNMITFETVIYFVKIKFSFPLLTLNTMNYQLNNITNVNYSIDKQYWKPWHKREDELPFGYQHMCHLWFNINKVSFINDNFNVYMRLDTDSFCRRMNMPDYFEILKNHENIVYLYNYIRPDRNTVVKDLWKDLYQFLDLESQSISQNDYKYTKNVLHTWKNMMKKHPKFKFNYKNIIPAVYTNFEVVRLSLFDKNKILNDFSKYIDEKGGIYKYRWGDAPLRFIQIAITTQIYNTRVVTGCVHKSKGKMLYPKQNDSTSH